VLEYVVTESSLEPRGRAGSRAPLKPCSTRAGVREDVPGEGIVGAGVRGDGELAGAGVVAGLRGGEELVVARAGERGVGVDGDLGAGVGLLEEGSPTPPAGSLKVDILDGEAVIRQSRVVVHRLVPGPSSPFVEHYVARRAHTQC
jgi:hypothetical protein